MMKRMTMVGLALLAMHAVPAAAQQRSAVSSTELRSAVTTASEENRATVQRFLQDDKVIEAAKSMGLRTEDLSARVGQLDDATLSQVASRTRAADLDLIGGQDYVIISTTAIIIILLVLILVT